MAANVASCCFALNPRATHMRVRSKGCAQEARLYRGQDRELLLAQTQRPALSGASDGGTTGVTPSALGAAADDSEAATGVSGCTEEVDGAPAPRRPVGPSTSGGSAPSSGKNALLQIPSDACWGALTGPTGRLRPVVCGTKRFMW